MGYSTEFIGGLKLNRELSHKEWLELRELANYDSRDNGTYEKYTDTPETIPDAFLQWEPNSDGTEIVWNGGEKFYNYIHWLRWLIKHYLKPRGLVLNGEIQWQGDEFGDTGVITAMDNKITHRKLVVEGLCKCPKCGHEFVPKSA